MKPNRQAKRYAEALLNVSTELDRVSDTGKSLLLIDSLIRNEKVFRAFFYTKRIETIKKVEIMKYVLGDLINPVVHEFFGLLAERNEYGIFLSVASAYGKLQRESLNIIDVTTFSIDEIDEDLIKSHDSRPDSLLSQVRCQLTRHRYRAHPLPGCGRHRAMAR